MEVLLLILHFRVLLEHGVLCVGLLLLLHDIYVPKVHLFFFGVKILKICLCHASEVAGIAGKVIKIIEIYKFGANN